MYSNILKGGKIVSRKKLKLLGKSQIRNNLSTLFVFYILSIAMRGTFIGFRVVFSNLWIWKTNSNYLYSFPSDFTIQYGVALIPSILLLVFYSPMQFSISNTYLELSKGKKINLNMIGTGYTQAWGKSILLNILIGVFTFLWSLLFIIPGIIKSYSYRLSFFILVDNPELSANEALRKSNEMMKGHKWDLFVLDISFIWWYILIIITFGIASVYVAPYINATMTNFYQSLKND